MNARSSPALDGDARNSQSDAAAASPPVAATPFDLQVRLNVLILIIGAVSLFAILFLGYSHSERTVELGRAGALNLAKQTARHHADLVETGRDILQTAAVLPNLSEPGAAACSDYLRGLQEAFVNFSAFALSGPEGTIFCASDPQSVGRSFADREYFQRALATKMFVIGDYGSGRITGRPVQPLAHPIVNANGDIERVLVTAIDLNALKQRILADSPADVTSIVLVDRSQTVLLGTGSAEALEGKPFPDSALYHEIGSRSEGLLSSGEGDAETMVAFSRQSMSYGLTYSIVSIDRTSLLSPLRHDILFSGGLIIVLTVAFVILAHYGARYVLISPLGNFAAVAERISRGEHTERIESLYPSGALRALAVAFDRMAEAVQRRETELRLQKQELERKNEELLTQGAILRQSQKMEMVGQLTGGIAHDFNNLLTVIQGNLELMELPPGGDPDLTRHLGIAKRGVGRASELTARLLAFSRRQILEPKVLSLNAVVRGMDDLLKRTLGDHVEVETVLTKHLHRIEADPHQLESAILNLAINARDAMPAGGLLTIETGNAVLDDVYCAQFSDLEPGQYAVISVTDTGVGMAPDIVERVFEPFFTTKASGKGTGLGLSMVYGFAKQSGGHVNIYSELGRGTTVRLYFPRVEKEESSNGHAVVAPVAIKPTECVLVVEDNPDVRQTAKAMLESLGYRVLTAPDGNVALKLLEVGDPEVHLVMTDVVMPGGVSGFDLAAILHLRYPQIKILLSSGYAEAAARRTAEGASDDLWLPKPYSRAALAAKLREALGK
jgi:signal transduction histidine kinase/ActR/RegA family two-component response regulator